MQEVWLLTKNPTHWSGIIFTNYKYEPFWRQPEKLIELRDSVKLKKNSCLCICVDWMIGATVFVFIIFARGRASSIEIKLKYSKELKRGITTLDATVYFTSIVNIFRIFFRIQSIISTFVFNCHLWSDKTPSFIIHK